jgi:hypothetical protein
MDNTTYTPLDPQHIIIGVPDLMERYDRGRTTISKIINGEHFPSPIAPWRWRLDHVLRYEELRASIKRDKPARNSDVADATVSTADQSATLETSPQASLEATTTTLANAANRSAALAVLAPRQTRHKAVK